MCAWFASTSSRPTWAEVEKRPTHPSSPVLRTSTQGRSDLRFLVTQIRRRGRRREEVGKVRKALVVNRPYDDHKSSTSGPTTSCRRSCRGLCVIDQVYSCGGSPCVGRDHVTCDPCPRAILDGYPSVSTVLTIVRTFLLDGRCVDIVPTVKVRED